ncbi:MAG: tetraacyldisaccharide 4'-kinase [Planctomycetota bacterium]
MTPSPLLLPAVPFYAAAVAARNAAYRLGILKTRKAPLPVISVGNLTAGGTGKTPFVAWLARALAADGRRPSILSRGYRPLETVPPSNVTGPANDETLELAALLPDVPIFCDPDRLRSATRARKAGADVAILDDGFQHRRIARDLDIVLVSATEGFGNDRLLPAGALREPVRALARAHLILLTRADLTEASALPPLRERIRRINPVPLLEARHAPEDLMPLTGGDPLPAHGFAGRRTHLCCGLGDPRAFRTTASRLGMVVASASLFPDHHTYRADDIAGVAAAARRSGATVILTTGKDAVKIRREWLPDIPFFALRITLRLTAGEATLRERLNTLLINNHFRDTSGGI